jgi:hypothetical protein
MIFGGRSRGLLLQFLNLCEQTLLEAFDLLGSLRFAGRQGMGKPQIRSRPPDKPTKKNVLIVPWVMALGGRPYVVCIICHGISSSPSLY